jgi:uncharacterized membrane protein YfcA
MLVLSPLFGALVGFSLGLTGGGGAIFAVPLLVYGLAVPPREAIGISLAAVGATALVGALQRLRAGEVDLRTGVVFGLAGMLGAPLGSWLNGYLPDPLLLGLFACLMAVVAVRMWWQASPHAHPTPPGRGPSTASYTAPQRRGVRSARGRGVFAGMGLATGVLSGLFGVGGGFVIVPALVLGSDMPMHRAVATSLVVITLVSAAGVTSYLAAGRPLGWSLASLFVLGGMAGMGLGTWLSRKLPGPQLQQGFAVALVLVAVFILTKSVL